MGVTGLWQILQPCARPIKIETLNRKRLAVDASIWIYQFLKAVRDKEGNALRNSHVVGFFRRICKLLFFGIKPVFVFDGGAPVLKRQTILGRKKRREGRREDAVRTAGRLLAVQMQRRAEEEEQQRRDKHTSGAREEEEVDEQNLVYVDELQMNAKERQENRRFRKKDAYHLPELDVSLNEMGAPNDPRIMSLEELEAYARQFDTSEDINVYDFSKIDYDSPFFMSLPASDRYNILNAARLRSRLRMGHSKEQLDSMFPDRMAFSRFQIERVTERNELTQRLMNINDPNNDLEFGINGTARVAGEKGREYVLVRNDGVEGGWALGVVSNEGRAEKPIDVDKPVPLMKALDEASDEEDDFEDVPIEGLNRLPKRPKTGNGWTKKPNKPSHRSRARATTRPPKARNIRHKDSNSLFVAQSSSEEEEHLPQDQDSDASLFGEENSQSNEDDDLNRAIALSLQTDDGGEETAGTAGEEADALELFQQSAVEEAPRVPTGNARMIANALNKRAYQAAPEGRVITSFGVPVVRSDSESDDDVMDLQVALKQSQGMKRKQPMPAKKILPETQKAQSASTIAQNAGFSGPLPFEKLDLGSSLLGKKKMQQHTEEAEGGFINPEAGVKKVPTQEAEPLPPWFTGDLEEGMKKQKVIEDEDHEKSRRFTEMFQFQNRDAPSRLRRYDTDQVIDLDADEESKLQESKSREVIDLERQESDHEQTFNPVSIHRSDQLHLSDMQPEMTAERREKLEIAPSTPAHEIIVREKYPTVDRNTAKQSTTSQNAKESEDSDDDDEEEIVEWGPSDEEDLAKLPSMVNTDPAKSGSSTINDHDVSEATHKETARGEAESRSPSMEFEDVEMTDSLAVKDAEEAEQGEDEDVTLPPSIDRQETLPEDDDFDDFSDPEEEELLKALTLEAEEHARFASSLNNKSHAENIAEYEKELKQLRNQQKKDRRDADEVTHVMVQECQHLLRLFGLPYVTAPMEAEAQCAELVRLGLVDGIVTDDSDCFLFGGTRVYKNMFNQAKFVECYLNSDLEKEFELDRDKLIQIAQLLGSDYTEGLPGVGPVTALEIISEFTSLEDFKSWLMGVQLQQITKDDDKDRPFRKKFRRQATKLMLPPAFPDSRVEMAYLEPEVDSDPEAFQWGVPDLEALRSFLMATIGWTAERTDEVLVPVIRDMNRRIDEGTQSNITAFFDGTVGLGASGNGGKGEAFAPRKRVGGSQRMGKALGRMAEKAKSNRSQQSKPSERHDADAVEEGGNKGGEEMDPAASSTPKTRGRQARRKAARTGIEES